MLSFRRSFILAAGIAASFACARHAHASLLLEESFQYQPGAFIAGLGNSGGAWTSANGLNTSKWLVVDGESAQPDYAAEGLQFPGLQVSGGSAYSYGYSDDDLGSQLKRSLLQPISFAQYPVLWVAFLLRKNDIGFDTNVGGGAFDYGLLSFSSSSSGVLRFGDVSNSGNYGISYIKPSGTGTSPQPVASGTAVPLGVTMLLVARISLNAEFPFGNAELFINPTPGDAAPNAAAVSFANFSLSDINQITYSVGEYPSYSFDEIRIGTTYSDVAPAPTPEPSSAALLAFAAAALGGRRFRKSRAIA